MIPPEIQQYVLMQRDRQGRNDTARFALRLPRHAEFTLTDLAPGTMTQAITWTVPVASDYAVIVTATTAAPFVGLIAGSVQAGSKTPAGCVLIIANRSGLSVGAALFDVLIFPM